MLTFFASEAPNGNQLASDINEVIWGSIAFFLVVGLLIWKAGPAVKAALVGRTNRIKAEFDEANLARAEAEGLLSTSTSDLPDVGAEGDRIRSEATTTAAKLKTDMIAKANADAEEMKARAITDIQTQSRQALADLRAEVAGLTRDVTEEVVNAELSSGGQGDLVDSYINTLGSVGSRA